MSAIKIVPREYLIKFFILASIHLEKHAFVRRISDHTWYHFCLENFLIPFLPEFNHMSSSKHTFRLSSSFKKMAKASQTHIHSSNMYVQCISPLTCGTYVALTSSTARPLEPSIFKTEPKQRALVQILTPSSPRPLSPPFLYLCLWAQTQVFFQRSDALVAKKKWSKSKSTSGPSELHLHTFPSSEARQCNSTCSTGGLSPWSCSSVSPDTFQKAECGRHRLLHSSSNTTRAAAAAAAGVVVAAARSCPQGNEEDSRVGR